MENFLKNVNTIVIPRTPPMENIRYDKAMFSEWGCSANTENPMNVSAMTNGLSVKCINVLKCFLTTVPIAKKILPLLDVSGEYLIELNGKQLKYRYAYDLLSEYMENLGMDHEFHDTRHTTATLLEKAEVPLLHRKLILGHSSGDVTDRYTHVALEQLVEDIDLI